MGLVGINLLSRLINQANCHIESGGQGAWCPVHDGIGLLLRNARIADHVDKQLPFRNELLQLLQQARENIVRVLHQEHPLRSHLVHSICARWQAVADCCLVYIYKLYSII